MPGSIIILELKGTDEYSKALKTRQQVRIHKRPGNTVTNENCGDVAMDTEKSALKRLEVYKRKRIRRKRIVAAALLFTFLLTAGIVIVDRSVNALVSGKQAFSMVDVENHGTILEITIMNHKIAINTVYLKQDLERLGKFLEEVIQKMRMVLPSHDM